MKKHFLLIVFLFSQLPSFAQEPINFEKHKPTPFISEIEIFVGPFISFLRGNIGVEDSYNKTRKLKVGYTFGFGVNHVMKDMFAIDSKLLLKEKDL